MCSDFAGIIELIGSHSLELCSAVPFFLQISPHETGFSGHWRAMDNFVGVFWSADRARYAPPTLALLACSPDLVLCTVDETFCATMQASPLNTGASAGTTSPSQGALCSLEGGTLRGLALLELGGFARGGRDSSVL
jgi:hypothetical protein